MNTELFEALEFNTIEDVRKFIELYQFQFPINIINVIDCEDIRGFCELKDSELGQKVIVTPKRTNLIDKVHDLLLVKRTQIINKILSILGERSLDLFYLTALCQAGESRSYLTPIYLNKVLGIKPTSNHTPDTSLDPAFWEGFGIKPMINFRLSFQTLDEVAADFLYVDGQGHVVFTSNKQPTNLLIVTLDLLDPSRFSTSARNDFKNLLNCLQKQTKDRSIQDFEILLLLVDEFCVWDMFSPMNYES